MKNYIHKIMVVAILGVGLASCEKDIPFFEGGEGLNFFYTTPNDTLVNFSFVYGLKTATRDTIWLNMETIGRLSEETRSISLEQVKTGNDAIPDIHYVGFDDPGVKDLYVAPGGVARFSIPIIVLRDPSLTTKTVELKIRIRSNEHFSLHDPLRNQSRLIISDQLVRPAYWSQGMWTYFGVYGPEKHRWLIEVTGERWDDTYLGETLGMTPEFISPTHDAGYVRYLSDGLKLKLVKYNEDLAAQGKGPVAEKDGTPIKLTYY